MVPAGVGDSCCRPERVLSVGGKTIDDQRAVVHLNLLNDGVVMTGQVGYPRSWTHLLMSR
jgi:hypothetical protein